MASILKVNTIQDATNSNTAISVDSSGHVSHPVRPYFSVKQDDGQSVASSTQTTILFTGTYRQRGSDYDSSSGAFTAPITGLYHFSADVQIASRTQWQFFFVHSNSGGSAISTYYNFNGNSGTYVTRASGSHLVQMTASDTMVCRVTHFLGSNQNVFGNFHGYFIG